ncbi:MAG: TIM44-related membrane protein TimA [Phenylobacterium sp.]|nr:TIM44-related membrane protein TimA [Phenylobacterium sp.]
MPGSGAAPAAAGRDSASDIRGLRLGHGPPGAAFKPAGLAITRPFPAQSRAPAPDARGICLYIVTETHDRSDLNPAVLQLILLALVAAVALLQLYAVLGRRMGRQPEERAAQPEPAGAARRPAVPLTIEPAPVEEAPTGLSAVRARDPGFDPQVFLANTRNSYRTIVTAYAAGDRETLAPLLTEEVRKAFEAGIAEREAAGREESVDLPHPPRSDVETVEFEGDRVRIGVRFLGELVQTQKASKDAEPRVHQRRTAELWTFERNLSDRDGGWRLAGVDVAEA